MGSNVYDVIIVGAGMIGSAAARYVSESKQCKVCVIGPSEPTKNSGSDIFGAHYDEARITNSTQSHPIWAQLAARSMAQYRHLEEISGIPFYEEVNSIYIGTKNGRVIKTGLDAARECKHETALLDHKQSMEKFPFIYLNENEQAMYQREAGYVNPRKLVAAELKVAAENNCVIIRDIVSRIVYPQDTRDPLTLETDLGNTFYARKVLLATGAFTELRRLLPKGIKPDINLLTQSVIYAEVSESDVIMMKTMPSVVKVIETDADSSNDCYILPPVKYPDGKFYIKLGHGAEFDKVVPSSYVSEWYQGPVPEHIERRLTQTLRNVFPDLQPVSISSNTCITTRTPRKSLMLDLVTPTLGVALAGNGYAAKASDYIGKLAADLILTCDWSSDLPRDWFRFSSSATKFKSAL